MTKAALFIDNSNFYHSLKDSRRLPFPPSDYEELFTLLSRQFGLELKHIFLYDAVKDSSKEKAQYAQQQKFHSGIRALSERWPITIRTRKLKYRSFGKEFIPERERSRRPPGHRCDNNSFEKGCRNDNCTFRRCRFRSTDRIFERSENRDSEPSPLLGKFNGIKRILRLSHIDHIRK